MRKLPGSVSTLLVAGILIYGIASGVVEGATLNVANNGLDNATCGKKTAPCRSISRAMVNAHDGDRIMVGPGQYGDLNGKGMFEPGSGEEAAEVGFGCVCMIKVDKSVTLESTDGAAATVLETGGADLRGVVIMAHGVVFGKKQRGFTISHARREGLLLDGNTREVAVVGNRASGNGSNGNDAFFVQGSGHTVSNNVASDNARAGFGVHGSDQKVKDNIADSNVLGFDVSSGHFTGNLVTGNQLHGFVVNGSDVEIHRNHIVSNGNLGIRASSTAVITENNIFGNDTLGGNCGLLNQSGTTLAAPNNFWGVPSGPGPDPADAVCNDAGLTTIVDPVATKAFHIAVRAEP
jgi:Right handed beta helix region